MKLLIKNEYDRLALKEFLNDDVKNFSLDKAVLDDLATYFSAYLIDEKIKLDKGQGESYGN